MKATNIRRADKKILDTLELNKAKSRLLSNRHGHTVTTITDEQWSKYFPVLSCTNRKKRKR